MVWLDVRNEKAMYLGCVNVGGGLQEVYETASSPLGRLIEGKLRYSFLMPDVCHPVAWDSNRFLLSGGGCFGTVRRLALFHKE